MEVKLKKLKEMMSPEYDWDAHWDGVENDTIEDIGLTEIFTECFKTSLCGSGDNLAGYRCTGFDVEDTPKSLYRALFLGQPKKVDFSDMYKTGMLFAFVSPCGNFFATIELFKYEFGVYAYCKNKDDISGYSSAVVGGWPWANNKIECTNPLGKLWFEVLKNALDYEHSVYSGNEFKV